MKKLSSLAAAALLTQLGLPAEFVDAPVKSAQSLKEGAQQQNGLQKGQPNRAAEQLRALNAMFSGDVVGFSHRHLKRTGWTNARYQRHSRKLRNRARHRRACRG